MGRMDVGESGNVVVVAHNRLAGHRREHGTRWYLVEAMGSGWAEVIAFIGPADGSVAASDRRSR
jgi:hypothetical protein